MDESGICIIGDGLFSKTIRFDDINYIEANWDAKVEIFNKWCAFINSFDSSVHLQLTIFNRHMSIERFEQQKLLKMVETTSSVEEQKQLTQLLNIRKEELTEEERAQLKKLSANGASAHNILRGAYNKIMLEKILIGDNNILREKYITVTISAVDYTTADRMLAKECEIIMTRFKEIDIRGRILTGKERLELMSCIMRPHEPFVLNYQNLLSLGARTKDFIVPEHFDFSAKQRVMIDYESFTQTVAIYDLPSEIADKIISDLMEVPTHLTFNLHLDALEKDEATDLVKSKLAGMDIQKRDETLKLIKNLNGVFDDTLLPRELIDSRDNAMKMLTDLKNGSQKLFKTALLINIYANELNELEETFMLIKKVMERHSCKMNRLIDFQEDALNATLPIGRCKLPLRRTLTTASTGVFTPFTTQELAHKNGLYYGINQASKNLIYLDKTNLDNRNGFVLAKSGAGKSFQLKTEIAQRILRGEDVIIIDPEREYTSTAEAIGGQIIEISTHSKDYVNPFDISFDYAEGDNPVEAKAEFILTLLELILGGRTGLSSATRSVIDRVVRLIYEGYFKDRDTKPENMPTFKNFQQTLKQQPEEEARQLALELEVYVEGSLSIFANQTNVDINKMLVVYDIKDLKTNMTNMGLSIILDQVWNRISKNRDNNRLTWVYIDEVYLQFKNEYSATHLKELYQRVRKWGGAITAATNNVEELMKSDVARGMIANSESTLILPLNKVDRELVGELLNLSEKQLSYITNGDRGTGLIRAGSTIIPFDNRMDPERDKILFELFQTDINSVTNDGTN